MRVYADGTIDSVKYELLAETLRSFGVARLRAVGSSMLPTVRPGDVLHMERRDVSEIAVGEIAVFECYSRVVIHRVTKIQQTNAGLCFVAQGDTVPETDPAVGSNELLGVVTKIIRGQQILVPAKTLGFRARVTAALARRSSRIARIMDSAYTRSAALRSDDVPETSDLTRRPA